MSEILHGCHPSRLRHPADDAVACTDKNVSKKASWGQAPRGWGRDDNRHHQIRWHGSNARVRKAALRKEKLNKLLCRTTPQEATESEVELRKQNRKEKHVWWREHARTYPFHQQSPWEVSFSRTNYGKERLDHALPTILNYFHSKEVDIMKLNPKKTVEMFL